LKENLLSLGGEMKTKQRTWLVLSLIGLFLILLAGCNMPATPDENVQQTSAAQTEKASQQEQPTKTQAVTLPTATEPVGDEGSGDQNGGQSDDITPTATQQISITPTGDGEEVGEDRAEFITIEFEKGEKLGSPTQIKLSKSVQPNEFIDISLEFTVPNATGEYSSYWILKNEDGQKIGVAEEGKYFSMFMIIQAVSETSNGGQNGSGSIAGGAKITNATVSVDTPNYSGSCPAQLTFTYTVTTSNAGKVNFQLKFGVISPAGYKFDPTPQYSVDFSGGYTVTYTYSLFSSNAVNATAKVEAVGSNTITSAPVSFSVKCN
jgi:hypothetical protein